MTKKLVFAFGLLVLSVTTLVAQQASVSAGGNAIGSGGSSNYSVGQTFYSSNSGSHRNIDEGVQQPYEISIITGISDERFSLSAEVYPNPVQSELTLSTDIDLKEKVLFQLIDMEGKVLSQQDIHQPVLSIPMESLPAGSYLLRVMQKNKEMKSFKIVKNN